MDREPFSIHPVLEAHIRKQSEEENRLLEESILAEGCRDPLVVWREEGVLVDGHHRKAICDKHGVPYSVVYRSFPDIEAVKAWMDLNQLGRRNLSKEDRDALIRRLAAAGVGKDKIVEFAKVSPRRVNQILVGKEEISQATEITNSELTVTAKLKDELARAKEKISLLETLRLENSRIAAALEEAKRAQSPVALPEPKVERVEVEVIKEVVPEEIKQKLKQYEDYITETRLREINAVKLEEKKDNLLREIQQLREEANRARSEKGLIDGFDFLQTASSVTEKIVDMAGRGTLTIEQITEAERIFKGMLVAANNGIQAIRDIQGITKEGGGLRVVR